MAYPTPDVDTTAEPAGTTLILAYLDAMVALINSHFQDALQHGQRIAPNIQSGTSYTLALTDVGKVVEMGNAAPNQLIVPANASIAFNTNSVLEIYQAGAGQTTVVAASGVTVRNAGALRAQYSTAALRKRAANEWVLSGDLA